MRSAFKWNVILLVFFAFACGDDGPTPEEGPSLYLVTPGKADNYWSNVATEFKVSGTIDVHLDADQLQDDFRREQEIAYRTTAVGLYLTTYLTDKFLGIDIDGDGVISENEIFFRNVDYGGYQAMVRNHTIEVQDWEEGDRELRVSFSIDVAGPDNLMELLMNNGASRTEGGVAFDLAMPQGATADPDRVDRRVIRNFDASTYTGALEFVTLDVVPLPYLADTYPPYLDWFADDVYDITMFFGHDYNAARYDILDAREMFDHLLARGYRAPVATFDDLTWRSGAFVRDLEVRHDPSPSCVLEEALRLVNDPKTTVPDLQAVGFRSHAARNTLDWRNGPDGIAGTADDRIFESFADIQSVFQVGPVTITNLQRAMEEGPCSGSQIRQVRVEVRLYHSDMFIGARQLQKNLAMEEMVSRDVFFYNGHAGPYYGFYMDEYGQADIGMAEFAQMPFRRGVQQLVVAQGCQTYSQYADMLYAHPNRPESELSVITTVNYSYGRGTTQLFDAITWTIDGHHYPATYQEIIRHVNSESINNARDVFYGVHGLEHRPGISPYANQAMVGEQCQSVSDCGANTDANLCLFYQDGISRCVARASSSIGCPEGMNYAYVGDDTHLIGGVCYR